MAHLPPVAKPPNLIVPERLTPFVDPLPRSPTARPVRLEPSPSDPKRRIPLYEIPIREFFAQIHRELPATRFWRFASSVPGPSFETRQGEDILVEWQNKLPAKHFLRIDHNLMGAEKDKPEVRTVVHVHGTRVPASSDGYPDDWITPGQCRRYYYPNQQESCMLWYHDHAMGINRLNICAGCLAPISLEIFLKEHSIYRKGNSKFRRFSLIAILPPTANFTIPFYNVLMLLGFLNFSATACW